MLRSRSKEKIISLNHLFGKGRVLNWRVCVVRKARGIHSSYSGCSLCSPVFSPGQANGSIHHPLFPFSGWYLLKRSAVGEGQDGEGLTAFSLLFRSTPAGTKPRTLDFVDSSRPLAAADCSPVLLVLALVPLCAVAAQVSAHQSSIKGAATLF